MEPGPVPRPWRPAPAPMPAAAPRVAGSPASAMGHRASITTSATRRSRTARQAPAAPLQPVRWPHAGPPAAPRGWVPGSRRLALWSNAEWRRTLSRSSHLLLCSGRREEPDTALGHALSAWGCLSSLADGLRGQHLSPFALPPQVPECQSATHAPVPVPTPPLAFCSRFFESDHYTCILIL